MDGKPQNGVEHDHICDIDTCCEDGLWGLEHVPSVKSLMRDELTRLS
jgi:hypothetical protein